MHYLAFADQKSHAQTRCNNKQSRWHDGEEQLLEAEVEIESSSILLQQCAIIGVKNHDEQVCVCVADKSMVANSAGHYVFLSVTVA